MHTFMNSYDNTPNRQPSICDEVKNRRDFILSNDMLGTVYYYYQCERVGSFRRVLMYAVNFANCEVFAFYDGENGLPLGGTCANSDDAVTIMLAYGEGRDPHLGASSGEEARDEA